MADTEGKIILYQTDDGKVAVDVRFEDETFWLTRKAMSELDRIFEKDAETA